jgi:transposase
MFVGWDWAGETHDVTVLDPDGSVADRWALRHDEADLAAALARLARHRTPADLPIAIEASTGLVVERLLAAGHPVVPIHPNAFHAARPRWGASKSKSDPGDSYKLADYLRTDGHRLARLKPLDQATRNLQLLTRSRRDHLDARVAATNQLDALLAAHWPGARAVFARLDSDIALDFLDRYPTPATAAHLGEGRMTAFCRRHRYCGRRAPAELLARLRDAPATTGALDPDTLTEVIGAQVRLLRSLLRTIDELDHAIIAALPSHPKAPLLAPLPRIGQLNLAQILAEVGPILDRADTFEHACAEVGVTPVTKQSGKNTAVHFRWAVNTRARDAFTRWADNSRHSNHWAAQRYREARNRGHRHPTAARILARSWLRVVWACWQTNTAYQPHLHSSATNLTSTAA